MYRAVAVNTWVEIGEGHEAYGGNSKVYRVKRDGDERVYAKKVFTNFRQAERLERFAREVTTAARLDHPGVVRVVDYRLPEQPTSEDPPYLVTLWADGGTFANKFLTGSAHSVSDAIRAAIPVFKAVKCLHDNGVWHRDIKPANVLIHEGSPVLCDLGLALGYAHLDDRLTATWGDAVGSRGYIPPEYRDGRYEQTNDHGPGDVFGLGSTLWALAAGRHPPVHEDNLVLPEFNLVTSEASHEVSKLMDLIARMTSAEPRDRIDIDQALELARGVLEDDQRGNPSVDTPASENLAEIARLIRTDGEALAKKRRAERERKAQNIRNGILNSVMKAVSAQPDARTLVDETLGKAIAITLTTGANPVGLAGTLMHGVRTEDVRWSGTSERKRADAAATGEGVLLILGSNNPGVAPTILYFGVGAVPGAGGEIALGEVRVATFIAQRLSMKPAVVQVEGDSVVAYRLPARGAAAALIALVPQQIVRFNNVIGRMLKAAR